VLFCDLVGSTEIAHQLDPEEWREIVSDYQRAASNAINRSTRLVLTTNRQKIFSHIPVRTASQGRLILSMTHRPLKEQPNNAVNRDEYYEEI